MYNWIGRIQWTSTCLQVMGVLDLQRTNEKRYETLVKEGFCEEVSLLRSHFVSIWFLFIYVLTLSDIFLKILSCQIKNFKNKENLCFFAIDVVASQKQRTYSFLYYEIHYWVLMDTKKPPYIFTTWLIYLFLPYLTSVDVQHLATPQMRRITINWFHKLRQQILFTLHFYVS